MNNHFKKYLTPGSVILIVMFLTGTLLALFDKSIGEDLICTAVVGTIIWAIERTGS